MTELVTQLLEAREADALRLKARMARLDLLVLDELARADEQGGVVVRRDQLAYERASVIVT